MIPTLGSSAFVFLFFSNWLSQISPIKGRFVSLKKSYVKAIGDPLMVAEEYNQALNYLRRFLYVFPALSSLDCFLHDAFCVLMCINMTWQWPEGWMIPTPGSHVCVWECGVFFFFKFVFVFFQLPWITSPIEMLQDKFVSVENTISMWKQLVTIWWLLRSTSRSENSCMCFCTLVWCTDVFLHDMAITGHSTSFLLLKTS